MTIKETLMENIKIAMKSGDKDRLSVLRLISADFKKVEVDKRVEITDELAIEILTKMSSQRKESIRQFEAANRGDLVKQESYELGVISEYLPAPATDAEVDEVISIAISEASATSIKDLGKVISVVRSKLLGRSDMSQVSAKIKELLK